MWYEKPVERGLIPDPLIRLGIRRRLAKRLADERAGGPEAQSERKRELVAGLRTAPVAIDTDKANEQHYELPPEFFSLVLGKWLKYSCALWEPGTDSLDDAEEAMLRLYAERAQIEDGMHVLDLGCGWGSLSTWLCSRFENIRVTAVSNSAAQKTFIDARAAELGIRNLRVITADANIFETDPESFDRVVSIEMFEHMKNYATLMQRIASWLKPHGALFVHIFTHRTIAYHYEPTNDWIGRYFFTGGTLPSDDLLLHFQDHLRLDDHWLVDGRHYEKTANAWLRRFDERRAQIEPVLRAAYAEQAPRWRARWRLFFLACAEFWGFNEGRDWMVSHYRFRKP